ncbi:hypothetical protein D3C78_1881310 [compost metagenome]
MKEARFVIAVNNGEQSLETALNTQLSFKDARTGAQLQRNEGSGLHVSLNKGEMRVLFNNNKDGEAL